MCSRGKYLLEVQKGPAFTRNSNSQYSTVRQYFYWKTVVSLTRSLKVVHFKDEVYKSQSNHR